MRCSKNQYLPVHKNKDQKKKKLKFTIFRILRPSVTSYLLLSCAKTIEDIGTNSLIHWVFYVKLGANLFFL